MNTAPDNRKVTAYLDHELTLEETVAFEKQLPPEAPQKLQAEMALESALAARMKTPECPDALWETLRREMTKEHRPVLLRFPRRPLLWLAAAASLAIFAGLHLREGEIPLLKGVSTVAALQAEAAMQPPAAVLAENGFRLSIEPAPADAHHKIEILGSYSAELDGAPVAVICATCCNEPLRVLVTRKEGRAAEALLRGRNRENLQTIAWRGDYLLSVVGTHPASEVLNLFKEVQLPKEKVS